MRDTKALTQLAFEGDDFEIAERIAAALGYQQTAYTSTSALWGLTCLPENPRTAKPGEATRGASIVKTAELGFLFVQHLEDLGADGKDVIGPMTRESGRKAARAIAAARWPAQ